MGITERKLCSAMAEWNQQIMSETSVQWHRKRGTGSISLTAFRLNFISPKCSQLRFVNSKTEKIFIALFQNIFFPEICYMTCS